MIPQPFNIESELADYFRVCFGEPVPGLPAAQYRETRQAFYAGVACMLGWVNQWAETEPSAEADKVYAAQVQMVTAQLEAFARGLTGN
jgi:hypothetical protein